MLCFSALISFLAGLNHMPSTDCCWMEIEFHASPTAQIHRSQHSPIPKASPNSVSVTLAVLKQWLAPKLPIEESVSWCHSGSPTVQFDGKPDHRIRINGNITQYLSLPNSQVEGQLSIVRRVDGYENQMLTSLSPTWPRRSRMNYIGPKSICNWTANWSALPLTIVQYCCLTKFCSF